MTTEQTTTPRIGIDGVLEVAKDVDPNDLYEAIHTRIHNTAALAGAGIHIESLDPLYRDYFGAMAHTLWEAVDMLEELHRRAVLPAVKGDPS